MIGLLLNASNLVNTLRTDLNESRSFNIEACTAVDQWKLLNNVEEWIKAGSKVYSCYEAGLCGYGITEN